MFSLEGKTDTQHHHYCAVIAGDWKTPQHWSDEMGGTQQIPHRLLPDCDMHRPDPCTLQWVTAAPVVNKQNDDLERNVGVYLFNHAYVCLCL